MKGVEHRCGAALWRRRNRLDHHNPGSASRIAKRPIARRNGQTQAQSQFEIGGVVAGSAATVFDGLAPVEECNRFGIPCRPKARNQGAALGNGGIGGRMPVRNDEGNRLAALGDGKFLSALNGSKNFRQAGFGFKNGNGFHVGWLDT